MAKKAKTPFEIACGFFKTKAAFARALKVTPPYINKILRDKHVPTEQCRNIERATGGRVTAAQLRPDFFGPIDYSSDEKPAVNDEQCRPSRRVSASAGLR